MQKELTASASFLGQYNFLGLIPPSSGVHAIGIVSLILCHFDSTPEKYECIWDWGVGVFLPFLVLPGLHHNTAPLGMAFVGWLKFTHQVTSCLHPFYHILCCLVTIHSVLKTWAWNMWQGKDYIFTDPFPTRTSSHCLFSPLQTINFPSTHGESLVTPQASLFWVGEG